MRAFLLAAVTAVAITTPALAAEATFGLGDIVYRQELKEPLPNVFGGKDIWGRKRKIGYIEVRYLGLEGQTAKFLRRDVSILTDETTVTRSGLATGYAYGNSVVVARGHDANVQALPPNELLIPVELGPDAALIVSGTSLRVIAATGSTVTVDVPADRK